MADKTQGQTVITALIIPLSSASAPPRPTPPGGQPPQPGRPDQTLPGQLPKPSHPIYFPLPPGAPVDPEYGVPEGGEHPDQGLPGEQPKPDQGLPGSQPKPEHPIVLPPDQGQGGWGPIYIWGGGPGARPPIEIPDEGEPPPEQATVKWHAMWTPTTGWVSVAVVIPGTGTEKPTPSKKR